MYMQLYSQHGVPSSTSAYKDTKGSEDRTLGHNAPKRVSHTTHERKVLNRSNRVNDKKKKKGRQTADRLAVLEESG